jgi:hypothetical protein
MKDTTVKQHLPSKRLAGKTKAKLAAIKLAHPVVTFKVSRLTKPWALKGAEGVIRALSGTALNDIKVQVEINGLKAAAKRPVIQGPLKQSPGPKLTKGSKISIAESTRFKPQAV